MVDAGFSYTHAVPVFDWRALAAGVRRIDLGGKALTNYLKELVSYRRGGARGMRARAGGSASMEGEGSPTPGGPAPGGPAPGSRRSLQPRLSRACLLRSRPPLRCAAPLAGA